MLLQQEYQRALEPFRGLHRVSHFITALSRLIPARRCSEAAPPPRQLPEQPYFTHQNEEGERTRPAEGGY